MNKHLVRLATAALALLPPHATAGGVDEDVHDKDVLVFFGFVKDARGGPVPDANALARLRDVTFAVRTGATGAYRFPFFNKNVNPADVVISCEKPGYKQARVSRRAPVTKPDGPTSVETECRLERS